MEIKKLSNIADVNKLGIWEYYVASLNADDELLVIIGDRGNRHHYRVELRFIDLEYVACAPTFDGYGTFQLRFATPQEAATIHEYIDFPHGPVYCFEEDISRWQPPLQRKARTFFIAASRVEIALYYEGDFLDEILRYPESTHETP